MSIRLGLGTCGLSLKNWNYSHSYYSMRSSSVITASCLIQFFISNRLTFHIVITL